MPVFFRVLGLPLSEAEGGGHLALDEKPATPGKQHPVREHKDQEHHETREARVHAESSR